MLLMKSLMVSKLLLLKNFELDFKQTFNWFCCGFCCCSCCCCLEKQTKNEESEEAVEKASLFEVFITLFLFSLLLYCTKLLFWLLLLFILLLLLMLYPSKDLVAEVFCLRTSAFVVAGESDSSGFESKSRADERIDV